MVLVAWRDLHLCWVRMFLLSSWFSGSQMKNHPPSVDELDHVSLAGPRFSLQKDGASIPYDGGPTWRPRRFVVLIVTSLVDWCTSGIY